MILKNLFAVIACSSCFVTMAQQAGNQNEDSAKTVMLKEVNIEAFRNSGTEPFPVQVLKQSEIQKLNLGKDLPYLLEDQVSLVSSSDAGNGIGYTKLRMRGMDQSQMNVSINGIPYNDAESQQVYWVDIPDIAASSSDIQIRRGIGGSFNGTAAFGGHINLKTGMLSPEPYFQIAGSMGSFSTYKGSIGFCSGLVGNHFSMQGRISELRSAGFIDRSNARLYSANALAQWQNKYNLLRFQFISGNEKTQQAWYGIPEADLETDRTKNYAGMESVPPYEKQIDNYNQNHYQLHFTHYLKNGVDLNASLFYTRGYGFYEEYKADQDWSDYELGNGNSDLVRRRWLENDFYGMIFSSTCQLQEHFSFTSGGGINQYFGQHFGRVQWLPWATVYNPENNYYFNTGRKNDINVYEKINYRFGPDSKWNAYADLQYRYVFHRILGDDNDQRELDSRVQYHFVNPKAGISFFPKKQSQLYLSYAFAQREPNRSDLTDLPIGVDPLGNSYGNPVPEKLHDIEAGYTIREEKFRFAANYYFMYYKDQLVLNGKINDVGSPLRENVDQSVRTGIEFNGFWKFAKHLALQGNVSLSSNKILHYRQYIPAYDSSYQYLGMATQDLKNTTIAFSPSITAMAGFTVYPINGMEIHYIHQFVGKQYLDNSQSEDKKLNAYQLGNLRFSYSWIDRKSNETGLFVSVNNLWNQVYENNGYTYSALYLPSREITNYNYYYPQAGTNLLIGFNVKI